MIAKSTRKPHNHPSALSHSDVWRTFAGYLQFTGQPLVRSFTHQHQVLCPLLRRPRQGTHRPRSRRPALTFRRQVQRQILISCLLLRSCTKFAHRKVCDFPRFSFLCRPFLQDLGRNRVWFYHVSTCSWFTSLFEQVLGLRGH